MATPWDRIIDEEYKAWLQNRQIDAHEYNGATLCDRSGLRTQFERQQQEQQQHGVPLDDVLEFVRKQMREVETLVFSKVKSDVYREVIHDLGMKLTGTEWSVRPTDLPDMDGFTWLTSREDSQENRSRYMSYLGENIRWAEGFVITDCHEYKDLLSVPELDGKHKTSGNIDVVLTARKEAENETIRQNIRAGIELKKDTNAGDHEYQVVLQHLAASSLNPDQSVLTVMTDLNERWIFYWFGSQRGILYKCILRNGNEAKFLFEHMFDDPNSIDANLLFPTNFLVRGTWRVFRGSNLKTIQESLSADSRDDDVFPPDGRNSRQGGSGHPHPDRSDRKGNKDGSKREVKHGPQVAGNDYTMDVANKLELLDFVDEEEKRAIELRFLAEHVVTKMFYVPEQNHGDKVDEGYRRLSEENLFIHNTI